VALLQDIGMLALDKVMPDAYSKMLNQAGNDHGQLEQLEQQSLGCDHSDLSVYLAGRWNLPEAFVTAFEHSHETKLAALLELEMSTRCAVLSGDLCDIWLGGKNLDAFCEASMKAQTVLDMPPETLEAVLGKVGDALPDLSTVFEVDLGSTEATNAVLEQAKEALLTISLETMQEAQRTKATTDILESENRSLKQQVDRDPLTELYNRYFLEEALTREFEQARHSKRPLSLVFFDIDSFKSVNDRHGHPLGDQIIVAVARIIERNLLHTDVAARYGGEEFVLVLPGTNSTSASKISQRIIQLLAEESFSGTNGESFSVTMSGGFATYSEGCAFENPSALIEAADVSLYAAKHQGGNRIVAESLQLLNPTHLPQTASKVH